ncbi:TPA: phage neck terminator protein [Citrobacter freundii]
MAGYTVKLMTNNGEVSYPDYRAEKGTFTANGNSKDIMFTPYNGSDIVFITAIELADGSNPPINIPADFALSVGCVVKFPSGTLKTTDSQAKPLILTGAPYVALVRLRQALMQLVGDNPLYAMQKLPEPKEQFTALHLLSSGREPSPFAKTWDGDYRVYHYNCTASVLVIRSSDDAQDFLENFMLEVDSTDGDFWQFNNNCSIDRSGDFENRSPLIDNLVYQQMAQVTLSLQFVYQHYKRERWLDSATVEKGNKVTIVIKGA